MYRDCSTIIKSFDFYLVSHDFVNTISKSKIRTTKNQKRLFIAILGPI